MSRKSLVETGAICEVYVTLTGFFLEEVPYCKFMLKHDIKNEIKNYFQKFTKTLGICSQ